MKLSFPFLIYSTIGIALFLLPTMLCAQDRTFHHEVVDDPYVSVSRSSMEKGPAYQVTGTNYFTRQVNVDER